MNVQTLLQSSKFSSLVSGVQARSRATPRTPHLLRSRNELTELERKHATSHLRSQQPGARVFQPITSLLRRHVLPSQRWPSPLTLSFCSLSCFQLVVR